MVVHGLAISKQAKWQPCVRVRLSLRYCLLQFFFAQVRATFLAHSIHFASFLSKIGQGNVRLPFYFEFSCTLYYHINVDTTGSPLRTKLTHSKHPALRSSLAAPPRDSRFSQSETPRCSDGSFFVFVVFFLSFNSKTLMFTWIFKVIEANISPKFKLQMQQSDHSYVTDVNRVHHGTWRAWFS